ncbi:MAG: TolC family protein [Sedimentisphaerales bacterium]|nr:TolC family protein [Sedimentisphaerales bacterium]
MSKNTLILLLFISAIISDGCKSPESHTIVPEAGIPKPDINYRNVTEQKNTDAYRAKEVNEPEGIIFLPETINFVLANNSKLQAMSLEVRAAEARKLQASLSPNPELEIEAEELGGTGERSRFDSSETTVQITQLVELSGKRSKRTRIAALEKETAELHYMAERLDIANEAAKAFIDVLAAQEQAALAEELVRLSEQAHLAVVQKVEAGKNAPVDQTMSNIALSNTRIEAEKAKSRLISARNRIASLWGGQNPVFEKAAGDFFESADMPELNQLTEMISQNPDVARWSVEKEKHRAALELEKAKKTSDIMFGGGLQYFNEGDDSSFIIGLAIPIPLFDRNQGNVLEATYMLSQTEHNRKTVEIQTRAALAEAVTTLSSVSKEITVLKEEVLPSAQEAFNAASEGYNEGKFEYLVVLDAQRTLYEASGKYIEATTNCHKARADIERLTGRDINYIQNLMNSKEAKN